MKIFFILMLLVLSAGCDNSGDKKTRISDEIICDDPTTKNIRADFILKCIENANPKSDEEPEGWIRICETMAENIYCDTRPMLHTYECRGMWPCIWVKTTSRPLENH